MTKQTYTVDVRRANALTGNGMNMIRTIRLTFLLLRSVIIMLQHGVIGLEPAR